MLSLTKRSSFWNIIFGLTILSFSSCQKEANFDNVTLVAPDLSTKVNSSVSGFVTDENDAPVQGSSVVVGGTTTTTDKYGYFEVKNVQVVKEAAVVMVTQPGYFKGIKTYMAVANKSAFFRIKLLPKTIAGTINAASGGNVTLPNGLKVALPANAVVTASNNTVYAGTVSVALKYIDPTASDLNKYMPGDLRGLNTDGALKLLTSYGMAAVELTGTSGELLQMATGKKATLTMPFPASLLATAPPTIPLWYFDETKGLWQQEGTATKSGNTYVGDVAHFSFWNCDLPNDYVHFDCSLVDGAGQPIAGAFVVLHVAGGNAYNSWGTGITDQNGYVGGAIPANTQLEMEVHSNYGCAVALYTQNLSSGNTNISLGNITINLPAQAIVTGMITDCNNAPLTYGSVIVRANNEYSRYIASAAGVYNFSLLLCGNSTNALFIGEDVNTHVQGTPLNYTLISGNNSIPTLQACGTSTQEFLTYTDNGGSPINFTVPADTVRYAATGNQTMISASVGTNIPLSYFFTFENSNVAVGSSQNLTNIFSSTFVNLAAVNTPAILHITEFGTVGQFVAGNFSITATETGSPATVHHIICSFRVRRT